MKFFFPKDDAFGLSSKEDPVKSHKVIEVALKDASVFASALKAPVEFLFDAKKYTFHAQAALSATQKLMKVNCSGSPLRSFADLKEKLLETFKDYGNVLDIVLYEGDVAAE